MKILDNYGMRIIQNNFEIPSTHRQAWEHRYVDEYPKHSHSVRMQENELWLGV